MAVRISRRQIEYFESIGIRIRNDGGRQHTTSATQFPIELLSHHSEHGLMPLGAYSYSHSYSEHVAWVGRYSSIGDNMEVVLNTHPINRLSTSPAFYARRKYREWNGDLSKLEQLVPFEPESFPIHIGNDVWIGDDVSIRGGVTIGDGAVIAKRAIVTRDVPPYAVVAGIPARVIRMRFPEPVVEALLNSQWWDYAVSDLIELEPDQPEALISNLHYAIEEGSIQKLPEKRFTFTELLDAFEAQAEAAE